MVGDETPMGVKLRPLRTHADPRGSITELFREEWGVGLSPVQWNVVESGVNVLRGIHVHKRHADYWTLVEGEAVIGLKDLRRASPTCGLTATLHMRSDDMAAVVIPTGVAHGFYFTRPSIHVYAVTQYWDVADELACRWDDPGLGIEWHVSAPLLSARDAAAGTLAAMRLALEDRN